MLGVTLAITVRTIKTKTTEKIRDFYSKIGNLGITLTGSGVKHFLITPLEIAS